MADFFFYICEDDGDSLCKDKSSVQVEPSDIDDQLKNEVW